MIPALLFVLSLHMSAAAADDAGVRHCSVENGKIIIYSGDTVKSIQVEGTILGHSRSDNGIYYISTKRDGAAKHSLIGYVDFQTGELKYERALPINLDEFPVKKFTVAGSTAYILAGSGPSPEAMGMLNRIDINSMTNTRLAGVADFHAQDDFLVVLGKQESAMVLTMNDVSVPVTLSGEGALRIQVALDNRMVFVTNGEETDIIDLRSGLNIYRYGRDREMQVPGSYNLLVQAEDTQVSEQNDRDMVFYKVYIDGTESGRTDSGPSQLAREFRANIEPNKYHLIKLERWVLNASKGRYDRENNIRQPQIERIYIPMNRIVKLIIEFDSKRYKYKVVPVYK